MRKFEIIEVPKAECKICGEVKECVKFKYEDKVLKLFPQQEELTICETCLSHAFRKLRSDR